ncbi:tyrosine-type recombinase/integrase [Nocardia terpenica]|uniref:Tyrosine-type recombinase/integrase n=1 Tax=Nocardia terpenica TaxID=455432 RepID=A0A6G9ZDR1_9NOCA|nr:site-specific integrase [Nocardia terpenica]QIS23652.1 tyrosine-type recombinase/integrase [Nocardia terpenica]
MFGEGQHGAEGDSADVQQMALAGLSTPVLAAFKSELASMPFASDTRDTYLGRVGVYLRWLASSTDHPDALSTVEGRDRATAAYCEHLVNNSTINVTLAALDVFYRWLQLGQVTTPRAVVDQIESKTLTLKQQSRLLSAAAQRSLRDYALITLALDVGPRVSEIRALDDSDVTGDLGADDVEAALTAPNGTTRTVPVGVGTRAVLRAWRAERPRYLPASAVASGPLFLSFSGDGRLATRTIDDIIRFAGRTADLEISASTLRNTVEQRLLGSGLPDAVVATLMGQSEPNPARIRVLTPSAQLAFDLGA